MGGWVTWVITGQTETPATPVLWVVQARKALLGLLATEESWAWRARLAGTASRARLVTRAVPVLLANAAGWENLETTV